MVMNGAQVEDVVTKLSPGLKNKGTIIVTATITPEEVKKARLQEINALVETTARRRNQRYINNIESVLIEGLNPKNTSQIMGRTRTNRLTFVEIPKNIGLNYSFGDEINVKITEARSFSLTLSLIHI